MNQDHRLQNVYSGDDVRAVARAGRIDALQQVSKSQNDGNQYSRSNVGRMVGPGWVVNRKLGDRIRGSGAASLLRPWQIKVKTVNSQPYVYLRAGTINNMIPINMFDDFPVNSTGIAYVSVFVQTDGKAPTQLTVGTGTVPIPPPGINFWVAPFSFYVTIGVLNNLKVYQIIDDPIWIEPALAIQTLATNPAPGRPSLDNNYTWSIRTV